MADMIPKPLKSPPRVKKVTVKMSSELKRNLPVRILEEGYNMREKSKWVVEAVQSLLANKDWEGALLAEIISTTDAQDVFSIPSDIATEMNREARRVALDKPSLNANQSTIIRAAINRRLLGIFKLTGQGSANN